MASGNRKVRVLPKDLPPVIKLDTDIYGYLVRQRVIAEDRNRFSPWSQVIPVPTFDIDNLPAIVAGDISLAGSSVIIVWDDAADRPEYDIFVSWDGGDYEYHGTSPIHTYSVVNTESAVEIDVAIQVSSIEKERSDILTICEINAIIGS